MGGRLAKGVIKMLKHLLKNRFWFFKALETYGLGIYFIIRHSTGTFDPPPNSVLDLLDDPPFIFILAIVGTFVLVYSLWNLNTFLYKPIMTGLLTAVWLIFMLGFVFHDIATGAYVSFQAMYAGFVLVSMISEITLKE